ncbi:MAG: hypothetical protein ACTSX6_11635 [Candidatus Heimdallarchaeaceae archaeon]
MGVLNSYVTDSKYNNLRDIYQTVFMIQKILIVHQETSLPIFEKNVENIVPYDTSMITGILQAITTIGQEMIGRATGFKKLQFNGFVVTGAYSSGFMIYVFSETELVKELEKGMQNSIKWFSKTFQSQKDNWDGRLDIFTINKETIEKKICQHLFLWLLYPLYLSQDFQKDTEELSILGKEILNYIKNNNGCLSTHILDRFKEYGDEKILYEIFNLVIERFVNISTDD